MIYDPGAIAPVLNETDCTPALNLLWISDNILLPHRSYSSRSTVPGFDSGNTTATWERFRRMNCNRALVKPWIGSSTVLIEYGVRQIPEFVPA